MLPFKDRVLFLSPLIFLYSIELLFQSLPTLVSLIILSLIASFSFFILKRFLVFLFILSYECFCVFSFLCFITPPCIFLTCDAP